MFQDNAELYARISGRGSDAATFLKSIEMEYKLKVLGSGSSGNGYIIDGNKEALIMELGCKFDEYLKALDYDMSKVVGCVVSHRHTDHIRKDTLEKFLKYNIPVFGNDDVRELYNKVQPLPTPLFLGDFRVKHFDLIHNVQNTAYVIDMMNGARLLFATDTVMIPKIVKNVNIALVEANYDEDIIVQNAMEGIENRSQFFNHHSIERCIEYLSKLDHKCLCSVILCHLSGNNSNKSAFTKRVKETLGFENVFVAERNSCFILEGEEF